MKSKLIMALCAILFCMVIQGCTHTDAPPSNNKHSALPTAYVAATNTTSPTHTPILTPDTSESPASNYKVVFSMPMIPCDAQNIHRARYGESGQGFDWEEGDWSTLVVEPQYKNGFIVKADELDTLDDGYPYNKRGAVTQVWGLWGDDDIYMLHEYNFCIYVFEEGIHINTIDIYPRGGNVLYSEGLWYVFYLNQIIRVYDNESKLVGTIPYPSLPDEDKTSVNYIYSTNGESVICFVHTFFGSMATVRYEYDYYVVDGLKLTQVDAPSVATVDISSCAGEYIGDKFLYYGEEGYVTHKLSSRRYMTSDGIETDMKYYYVIAHDTLGNCIGGFDAFDYLDTRSLPRHMYIGQVKAYSTNVIYALIVRPDRYEIIKIPLEGGFTPFTQTEGSLEWNYEYILDRGLDQF